MKSVGGPAAVIDPRDTTATLALNAEQKTHYAATIGFAVLCVVG